MTRRGIAPATFVVALAVVGWLVTGVGVADLVKFVAYDIGFVALPGIALLWAVRGHRSGFLVTLALGWPIGEALEILAFSGTAQIGMRSLFLFYPIVVVVPCALVVWLRRRIARAETPVEPMSLQAMWIAAGAMALGLIYLTLMFLPLAPLPGSSVVVEYPDYPYFISLIAQVMNHWPPTTPGLVGVPLSYEWFVLFHIAAAGQVTGVSIPVIGLRLDYIPTVLVVGCQLLVVGRLLSRSWWTGVTAVLVIFLLGPLDLTSSTTTPFGDNVFIHLWDSWTFPFGMMFFLALVYLLVERVRAETWRTPRDLGSWALIALLMVGGSGAKATVLPVVIVGTGLYLVVRFLIRREISRAAIATVVLGIPIFIVTYVAVYGGQTPATHIDLFVWLSGGPAVLAANLIHHADIRAVVLPLAYAVDFVAVALPLAGMLYMLRRQHRPRLAAFGLPLCMFVSGVLISIVVHHSSYSELYFFDTGYVAGCFVAAEGLRLAWLDMGSALPVSRRTAVAAFVGWVVLLIVIVKLTENSVATPREQVNRYALILAIGVAFVIVCALAALARRRLNAGVIALGLIPLLAASALTSPILALPSARAALTGEPIANGRTVIVPGLLAALYWLRDHTPVNAVLAVNNHWIDPGRTFGKFYYYTALSERQAFIEAYNPYPIPPGPGTAAGADFIHRQQLNDAVMDHADASALQVLIQQYGVRYLLIDRTLGPYSPAVLKLGHVVFNNQDAAIVAVG
jgi:hypothetical protein